MASRPRAVADMRRGTGVMLDAVVLDHDHPLWVREVDAGNECPAASRTTNWCTGAEAPGGRACRRAVARGRSRESQALGTGVDRGAEPAATGPALGRESCRRAWSSASGDELATQRGVDVGVEHDGAQHASEVEERACRRRARDPVDFVARSSSSMTRLSCTTSRWWRVRRQRSQMISTTVVRPDGNPQESLRPTMRGHAVGPAAQQAASTSPATFAGRPHPVDGVVEEHPSARC